LGFIFAYLGGDEAPQLPRYPTLETPEAIITPFANYHDFNAFNNMENDPIHFPFTHRGLIGGGFVGMISTVECSETPWGYSAVLDFSGKSPTMVMQWGMPNMSNIPGSTALGADAEMGVWTEHMSWKVPVDDEHGVHFLAFVTHVPPENKERYNARSEDRAKALKVTNKQRTPYRELAHAILAGKLCIDDVDMDDVEPGGGMGLVLLQDWITQAGQGVIMRDRRTQRLGRSDASVILHRKLLSRDLRALQEGRPPKTWTYDPERAAISPRGTIVTAEMRVAQSFRVAS
jgi:hypothetical protein